MAVGGDFPEETAESEKERLRVWLRAYLAEEPELMPVALCTCLEILPPLPEEHQRATVRAFSSVHLALEEADELLAERVKTGDAIRRRQGLPHRPRPPYEREVEGL
jgi:hypothetical protein